MACLVFASALLVTPAAAADAYARLKLLHGRWNVTSSSGHSLELVNACARTGLFFVCEQAVGGKPADLVVFLPVSQGGEVFTYHTQALTAAGDRPGPWRRLTITSERWVYDDFQPPKGKGRRERTLNTFSGADSIHFETQSSTDGEQWTTLSAGDEHRAP